MSEIGFNFMPNPRAVLGCDGVLVVEPHKYDPLGRLFKRRPFGPLPTKPRVGEFVHGLHGQGVLVDGVLSSRFGWLHSSTVATVDRAGLSDLISPSQITHVTSDKGKARELLEAGEAGVVQALIDDKPHQVGRELVRRLATAPRSGDHRELVIGVPDDPRTPDRIERFGAAVLSDGITDVHMDHIYDGNGRRARGGDFAVTVVPLEPYSLQSAESFAGVIFARAG